MFVELISFGSALIGAGVGTLATWWFIDGKYDRDDSKENIAYLKSESRCEKKHIFT